MDLTLPVTGLGGRSPIHRPGATLACPPRLFEGIRPRTVKLHDLGPMHHACAGECHHIWLLLAPSCEGGRPLLYAAQLIRILAARYHTAIDQTTDDRRELPFCDSHHRLVERPEPLHEASHVDKEDALRLHGQGEQILIAETLADLSGLVFTGGLLLKHER